MVAQVVAFPPESHLRHRRNYYPFVYSVACHLLYRTLLNDTYISTIYTYNVGS